MKGKLDSSQRAEGERFIFLSLPKPQYFEIEKRVDNNETEILDWIAYWEGSEMCNNVLDSSKRKSEYWKKIILLYKALMKQCSEKENLKYLIQTAERDVEIWEQTTRIIRNQLDPESSV
jgi:hypothetical protein